MIVKFFLPEADVVPHVDLTSTSLIHHRGDDVKSVICSLVFLSADVKC